MREAPTGRLRNRMKNMVCPRWFICTFDNPLRRLLHDPRTILSGFVRKGQVVVDIGCGLGYFTIPLAELVGPAGRVIALDLQQPMLEGVRRRAQRAGVLDRIRLHRAGSGELGVSDPADFVLAFWMVHEVRDKAGLFRQIRALLIPRGRCLMVEPKIHVGPSAFDRTVEQARGAGLVPIAAPAIPLSRAVVLGAGMA